MLNFFLGLHSDNTVQRADFVIEEPEHLVKRNLFVCESEFLFKLTFDPVAVLDGGSRHNIQWMHHIDVAELQTVVGMFLH